MSDGSTIEWLSDGHCHWSLGDYVVACIAGVWGWWRKGDGRTHFAGSFDECTEAVEVDRG